MSPSPRLRRVNLWLLAAVQLAIAAFVVACSRSDDTTFAESAPYVVALALGASQGVLLATWFTLGAAGWLAWLLASSVLISFYFACYLGVNNNTLPFAEWTSMVLWWVGWPLVAGCLFGVAARRAGWRWRDRSEPLGPAINWSIGGALSALVVLALALGVTRWLHQFGAPIARFFLDFTRRLGNKIPGEAFFADPLIATCFFAAALGLVFVMRGPKPLWVLTPVALGSAALLGAMASYALPEDISKMQGMETIWICGTLAAAVNAFVVLAVLRVMGLRIDRPPGEPGEKTSPPDVTFDSLQ